MLRGESIVCLSSIDWDHKWQGHQEIMSALASAGNNVLFVENTGVRAPALRDAPRVIRRAKNWARSRRGPRQERERLLIHSPLTLPFPYSRLSRTINTPVLTRSIRAWARAVGCARPILWTFLPTPLAEDVIASLDPELTIYYCVDDLRSSSRGARKIALSEPSLLRRADLVFVSAARLRERAVQFRSDVHVFPFGVSFEMFARRTNGTAEPPPDLRQFDGPLVGYVGGVNHKVDHHLLACVAGRLPHVHFIVIGPVVTATSELDGCPNVHILGQRPHHEIPAYLDAFHAALIPYRVTEYTSHVYPAKLNEYLAAGLPVVATPLPEICAFNRQHGDIVRIAQDPETFCREVVRSLEESDAAAAARRVAAARTNCWEARIAAMTGLVAVTLAARRRIPSSRGPGDRVI
jgi:glycosyltransferase involved in cell wall biosynthesis